MKETYELLEVRGTENTIDYIQFAIHFQQDNEIVSVFKSGRLAASLDIDTDDEDVIIHSALNSIGAGDIQKIRKEAKQKFSEVTEWNTVHFNKKENQVGRSFFQLAAYELGVWSSIKQYFLGDTTELDQIYYENNMWCKTNPIMQKAMASLDKKTIDKLFSRAYQLQKESNIRDVFE